jgi:ribosomal protein S18 acetylase RimI-like enzyme
METVSTIRNADPADYDQIINQIDGWWGGRRMGVMLPRLFFTHFRPWTYVAVQGDAIIGFLAAFRSQTDPRLIYCHFIGVDPSFRHRGIGEALYQRLFSDATMQGCQEVLAVTSPKNHASIAFHTRIGFKPIDGLNYQGDIPYVPDYDGPGEDRVRFRRLLPEVPVGIRGG